MSQSQYILNNDQQQRAGIPLEDTNQHDANLPSQTVSLQELLNSNVSQPNSSGNQVQIWNSYSSSSQENPARKINNNNKSYKKYQENISTINNENDKGKRQVPSSSAFLKTPYSQQQQQQQSLTLHNNGPPLVSFSPPPPPPCSPPPCSLPPAPTEAFFSLDAPLPLPQTQVSSIKASPSFSSPPSQSLDALVRPSSKIHSHHHRQGPSFQQYLARLLRHTDVSHLDALDATISLDAHRFSPSPLIFHTCVSYHVTPLFIGKPTEGGNYGRFGLGYVPLKAGVGRGAHRLLIFGGITAVVNSRSSNGVRGKIRPKGISGRIPPLHISSECYEFSLATETWRRLETKRIFTVEQKESVNAVEVGAEQTVADNRMLVPYAGVKKSERSQQNCNGGSNNKTTIAYYSISSNNEQVGAAVFGHTATVTHMGDKMIVVGGWGMGGVPLSREENVFNTSEENQNANDDALRVRRQFIKALAGEDIIPESDSSIVAPDCLFIKKDDGSNSSHICIDSFYGNSSAEDLKKNNNYKNSKNINAVMKYQRSRSCSVVGTSNVNISGGGSSVCYSPRGILSLVQCLNLRTLTWTLIPTGHFFPIMFHTAVIRSYETHFDLPQGSSFPHSGSPSAMSTPTLNEDKVPLLYIFGGITPSLDVSGALIAINYITGVVRGFRMQSDDFPSPCPRYLHSACVCQERMIIYGGLNARNEVLSDVWAFDFDSEKWEKLQCVPSTTSIEGVAYSPETDENDKNEVEERQSRREVKQGRRGGIFASMGHSCCIVLNSRMLVYGGGNSVLDWAISKSRKKRSEIDKNGKKRHHYRNSKYDTAINLLDVQFMNGRPCLRELNLTPNSHGQYTWRDLPLNWVMRNEKNKAMKVGGRLIPAAFGTLTACGDQSSAILLGGLTRSCLNQNINNGIIKKRENESTKSHHHNGRLSRTLVFPGPRPDTREDRVHPAYSREVLSVCRRGPAQLSVSKCTSVNTSFSLTNGAGGGSNVLEEENKRIGSAGDGSVCGSTSATVAVNLTLIVRYPIMHLQRKTIKDSKKKHHKTGKHKIKSSSGSYSAESSSAASSSARSRRSGVSSSRSVSSYRSSEGSVSISRWSSSDRSSTSSIILSYSALSSSSSSSLSVSSTSLAAMKRRKRTFLKARHETFLRRQRDFVLKRDLEAQEHEQRINLEVRENTHTKLYLTEKEIETVLNGVDELICRVGDESYDIKTGLPGHIPDRVERIKAVEGAMKALRQMKDVLISMKGSDGGVGGISRSKTHRHKAGEKFEDFSVAKPFRQVLVNDLLEIVRGKLNELLLYNKTLKNVIWNEKSNYIEYTKDAHIALKTFQHLINAIVNRYIQATIASMENDTLKRKHNLSRLIDQVQRQQDSWKDPSQGGTRDKRLRKEMSGAGLAGIPLRYHSRIKADRKLFIAKVPRGAVREWLELGKASKEALEELMDQIQEQQIEKEVKGGGTISQSGALFPTPSTLPLSSSTPPPPPPSGMQWLDEDFSSTSNIPPAGERVPSTSLQSYIPGAVAPPLGPSLTKALAPEEQHRLVIRQTCQDAEVQIMSFRKLIISKDARLAVSLSSERDGDGTVKNTDVAEGGTEVGVPLSFKRLSITLSKEEMIEKILIDYSPCNDYVNNLSKKIDIIAKNIYALVQIPTFAKQQAGTEKGEARGGIPITPPRASVSSPHRPLSASKQLHKQQSGKEIVEKSPLEKAVYIAIDKCRTHIQCIRASFLSCPNPKNEFGTEKSANPTQKATSRSPSATSTRHKRKNDIKPCVPSHIAPRSPAKEKKTKTDTEKKVEEKVTLSGKPSASPSHRKKSAVKSSPPDFFPLSAAKKTTSNTGSSSSSHLPVGKKPTPEQTKRNDKRSKFSPETPEEGTTATVGPPQWENPYKEQQQFVTDESGFLTNNIPTKEFNAPLGQKEVATTLHDYGAVNTQPPPPIFYPSFSLTATETMAPIVPPPPALPPGVSAIGSSYVPPWIDMANNSSVWDNFSFNATDGGEGIRRGSRDFGIAAISEGPLESVRVQAQRTGIDAQKYYQRRQSFSPGTPREN